VTDGDFMVADNGSSGNGLTLPFELSGMDDHPYCFDRNFRETIPLTEISPAASRFLFDKGFSINNVLVVTKFGSPQRTDTGDIPYF